MALKLMTDGTTDISAAADGALYNFKTNGDYVFAGIGNEFAAVYSPTSRVVTIQSGEGVCGGRHVTEKKIALAKELLPLQTLTVSQIASLCGFSDMYYFSKVFTEHTGINPSKYKK